MNEIYDITYKKKQWKMKHKNFKIVNFTSYDD